MNEIIQLVSEYQSLNLHQIIDYDRFNQYAIVHHSSSIEGSTLTENETRLLLEEGITPGGKPLEHSLMVKDHYDALLFVLDAARNKQKADIAFIQAINAKVMRSTGSLYQTVFGEVDASKGSFRKGNVSAGGNYFVNFEKVETYTSEFVKSLQENLIKTETITDQLKLAFSAHFDLVSIHPFYDGNGRTSRLIMNYIQAYFHLPLAIVYKEDKSEYFTALQEARKQEKVDPFYNFILQQYQKFLLHEMQQFRLDMNKSLDLKKKEKKENNSGFSLFF
jgi:Fic family protein